MKKIKVFLLIVSIFLVNIERTSIVFAADAASLSLNTATTNPGGSVNLNLSIDVSQVSTNVAGVQWDLLFNSGDITNVTAANGAVATAAGKTTSCNMVSAGDFRCLVYGTNANIISSGVLSILTFTVSNSVTNTSIPIQLSAAISSDADGYPVVTNTANSSITVNIPAPTSKFPRKINITSVEGLSAVPSGLAMTATVLSTANSVLETQTGLTQDAQGNYVVSFLSSDPQLVNIRIKPVGYLASKLSNIDTQVNSGTALTVGNFKAGDFNDDNTINSLDYSILNSHYNQNFSQADINKDGIINSFDFAILKNNYNKSGQ